MTESKWKPAFDYSNKNMNFYKVGCNFDPALIDVIRKALVNIRDYHEKQRQNSWFTSTTKGTMLGQKITPLERVGVYVPGGKAVYPSSVLMNIVPAKVAGVEQIVMTTPPGKDG